MSNKRKDEGLFGVLHIPGDCWSVISSFFQNPSTVFNIRLSCKDLFEVFEMKTVRFCENLVFPIKCHEIILKTQSAVETRVSLIDILKSSRKNFFVRQISLSPLPLSKFSTLRSKDKIDNLMEGESGDSVVELIRTKFPRVESIRIQTNLSPTEKANPLPPIVLNISPLVNLREVNVNFEGKSEYARQIIDGFFGLPRLESLTLKNTSFVSHKNLRELFDKIRILRLENVKIPKLFQSESLLKLVLVNVNDDSYLKHAQYPHLRTFHFELNFLNNLSKRFRKRNSTKFQRILVHSKHLENISIIGFGLKNLKKQNAVVDDSYYFEDVRTAGVKKLDLSRSYFSGYFLNKKFENLISLNVSRCKFFNPKHINNPLFFENLVELNISYISCRFFKDEHLRNLTNLEILIMEGCNSNNISRNGFENFRKLKYVDIYNCYQKELDEEFIENLFNKNTRLQKIRILPKYFIFRDNSSFEKENDSDSDSDSDEPPPKFNFKARKLEMKKVVLAEGQYNGIISIWVWVVPDNPQLNKFKFRFCDQSSGCGKLIIVPKCPNCKQKMDLEYCPCCEDEEEDENENDILPKCSSDECKKVVCFECLKSCDYCSDSGSFCPDCASDSLKGCSFKGCDEMFCEDDINECLSSHYIDTHFNQLYD